jgi:Tol biopolymer transport system component
VVVGRTEAPTEVAPYDLWILDSKRGTSSRFTFDPGSEEYPRWSPDGKSIAFSSNRAGKLDIYVKPADGSAEEKLLYKSDLDKALICWSPDGRYILFAPTNPKTREDIWGLPVASAMQGDPKPFPILQTPASESLGELSPDGRWLAYVSVDGRPEVYVRPFSPEATAPSGPKWLVSTGNALIPHWRGDGKQLFYVSLSGEVSAVEIDAGKSFQAGKPRRLFVAPGLNLISTGWDVAPDGKRFLLPTANAGKPSPFVVVLNWLAGVKK